MIIKDIGDAPHFTKEFPCGATSMRLVLPTADNARVKVTCVETVKGAEWEDVSYPVDETVIIHQGAIELELSSGERVKLSTGDVYVVPAGEVYTLRDHHGNSILYCVFSQAGQDGVPVNDD